MSVVLQTADINAFYYNKNTAFFGKPIRTQVLFRVSLTLHAGETLALVGESGSGKSTLARVILGLEQQFTGQIHHHTQHPQMVFQDPYGSLNPRLTVQQMLEEPLKIIGERDRNIRRKKAADMLFQVGLDDTYLGRLPHKLSGGQRQRVSIAAALIQNPKLVVLDEPVSALDATIQADVLALLKRLQASHGLSYLFITHDLGIVADFCDRVMVMQQGHIVEHGTVADVFAHPQHIYTKALLDAALL